MNVADEHLVVYRDRRNTSSMKWDGCEDRFGEKELVPFWVADMDFAAPACVRKRLAAFVDFGVFGYYEPQPSYIEAFIAWEKTYHGYELSPDWVRFAPGVVPAINWWLHILTDVGDAVAIMPPVYYPFHDAIVNNDRSLVEVPLVRTDAGYQMDAPGLECAIRERDVKAFILCSPHNPAGRVWSACELQAVLDVCKRHGVYVIADEIHQDIIMPGFTHVAAATVGDYDDMMITLTSASKTFNLAACQNSFVVVPNKHLRERYDDYLRRLRIKGGNPFGYIAAETAYTQGRPWLDELIGIVAGNFRFLKDALVAALPRVWIPELEGSYLMWIDLGAYVDADQIEQTIQGSCGLAVDYGSWFGGTQSDHFIRINLATSRENIELVAKRLIETLHG